MPQTLSTIPLFSGLSSRQLRQVQRSAVEHTYEPGALIVRQGGKTTSLFVVIEGSAKVVRNDRTISRRRAGEFFGEISLIDGRPRAASVIAETPMRCLVLDQAPLRKLMANEPSVAWAMLQSLATRLRGE